RQPGPLRLLRPDRPGRLHRARPQRGQPAEFRGLDPHRGPGPAVRRRHPRPQRPDAGVVPALRPVPPLPAGRLPLHHHARELAPGGAQDSRRGPPAADRRGGPSRHPRRPRLRKRRRPPPGRPPGAGGDRASRLTVMDQDGFNPSFLTQSNEIILTPRFSSNSNEITYMALGEDYSRIYLLDLATGRRESLGQFDGQVFAPRFSPDG